MGDWLSPNFYINDIHIGTVQSASCVNIGNNWPTDFKNYSKQNQGFGAIGGDKNQFPNARAFLYDPDVVDLFDDPRTKDVPDWVKEMIEERSGRMP